MRRDQTEGGDRALIVLRGQFFGLYSTFLTLLCQFRIEFSAQQEKKSKYNQTVRATSSEVGERFRLTLVSIVL
jgi:hypothetical protein